MRKVTLLAVAFLVAAFTLVSAPQARADYYNYPCNYPFVGMSVGVRAGVDAGGQFCDGPTEVNGSHYHCQSMGASVGGGGLAFAPITGSPINLGGFGGSGIGGTGGSCDYRCPDGTVAPFPNPPGVWQRSMIIPKLNFCNGHETPQGPTSELIHPDEGGLGSGPGFAPAGTPPLGPNALPSPQPILQQPDQLPEPLPPNAPAEPAPQEPSRVTLPTELPVIPGVPPLPLP